MVWDHKGIKKSWTSIVSDEKPGLFGENAALPGTGRGFFFRSK